MLQLLKRPSGFLPLAISGFFLATLLTMLAQGRLIREPDEGTLAHLFQLLMPLQALIMVYFAVSWLQKKPKPALSVLALQSAAAVCVLAIVQWKHL